MNQALYAHMNNKRKMKKKKKEKKKEIRIKELNCSCPHCSLITLSTLSESFSGLS
jgi:hypothetical protein